MWSCFYAVRAVHQLTVPFLFNSAEKIGDDVLVATSLDNALEQVDTLSDVERVFVIGGEKLL